MSELRGNAKKEGDVSARLFGPFHPLLAERMAAIQTLETSGSFQANCNAMRKGLQ